MVKNLGTQDSCATLRTQVQSLVREDPTSQAIKSLDNNKAPAQSKTIKNKLLSLKKVRAIISTKANSGEHTLQKSDL